MLRTWFGTGMLAVGMSAALLAGCGVDHGDHSLGGSEDPLKGHNKPSSKDASKEEPKDAGQDDGASACAVLLCPPNSKCVVEEVQCVRAPCPPIAHCEPIAPEPVDAAAPTTCAATTCLTGTVCIDTPDGAECVVPKCTAKCSAGQHCELQQVQCIRAPCYPVPTCVDDVNACSRVRCKAGTHCELVEVQCIKAPCPPVPECRQDAPRSNEQR